jgi:hypothetical protein
MLQKAYFQIIFFLHYAVDSSSVHLALHFSLTLHSFRSEITNKLCPFSSQSEFLSWDFQQNLMG